MTRLSIPGAAIWRLWVGSDDYWSWCYFDLLEDKLGFSAIEIQQLMNNAVLASLLPEDRKKNYLNLIKPGTRI